MIRTIHSVKAFGVFKDFRWPASLPEFKQRNLIYGWNYSGKTTLARALRCFEQKQRHMDFPSAQVQLKGDDGTIYDLSNPSAAPTFCVFNTDFVCENLRFDVGSATPILVLGAEDIAKQGALKIKRAERAAAVSSRASNEASRSGINLAIEKALTSYARDRIKNPLSVPSYDKTRFLPKVNECRNAPEAGLLDEVSYGDCLSVYQATERKPSLPNVVVTLTPLSELKARAADLLAQVVTASSAIPRLKESPVLETWVKEGRQLHVGKTTCQFCAQPLPPELDSQLRAHFSADYERLMRDLGAALASVQLARGEEVTTSATGDLYPELQERFGTGKGLVDEALAARRAALATLEDAVKEKQTRAFTSLVCPPTADNARDVNAAIETVNGVIAEHNLRTAGFEERKQAAFSRLERHHAATFVRDEGYNESLQAAADLEAAITEQGKLVAELDADIRALERDVSDAAKGAERINELLGAYFGREDLRVAVAPEGSFQLARAGVTAKNLSEGEKTAIAFAYFITRVQDGRHPLADTIVVIDDPVSSLDANHLFNTFALIKTQFSVCQQLFVATHSYEFYDLVRDWLADDEGSGYAAKPQGNWKHWSVYHVKRTDGAEAVVEELPRELLRFRSEFHYLFALLYRFDQAAAANYDYLLGLPNAARRFIEAFGGIMIPRSEGLFKKMPRLFQDEVERERVWKFINHYSHSIGLTRSLTIPDMSECKAVVQACLRAVRDWDTDYFRDLETEVTS